MRSIAVSENENYTECKFKKCIFAVCALTLAFLKVSIRVYGVCMEHIACHLGHFTPLRHALESVC